MTLQEIKEVLEQNINGINVWSISNQICNNRQDNKRLFNTLNLNITATNYEVSQAIKNKLNIMEV